MDSHIKEIDIEQEEFEKNFGIFVIFSGVVTLFCALILLGFGPLLSSIMSSILFFLQIMLPWILLIVGIILTVYGIIMVRR